MVDFIRFKAEVKKQMILRGWTNDDLAKATGYKESTIRALMCGERTGDAVCKAVAKALDIPEYLAT